MAFRSLLLQLPKALEADGDCQDVGICQDELGRYALCDGASRSVLPRQWAEVLCCRVAKSGVPERASLADWLVWPRQSWRFLRDAQLRQSQNWWVQVPGWGAATFLAVQIEESSEQGGPARFRALAVGDTCIFWLRGDVLVSVAPCGSADAFTDHPAAILASSAPLPPDQISEVAGALELHDVLVLATDALAKWILRRYEAQQPVLAVLEELRTVEQLRELVQAELAAGRLDNDDISLMVIRYVEPDRSSPGAALCGGGS